MVLEFTAVFGRMLNTGGVDMAYKITYGPERPKRSKRKHRLLTVILIMIFIIGLRYSGIGEIIGKWLFPGDLEVTVAAWQTMTEQIEAGENIGDAFSCFCLEIIENAQLPQ